MGSEFNERVHCIEHLGTLLTEMQGLASRLANHSHGRAYDKVRELNELLHFVRQELNAIQADESSGAQQGIERRKTPRSQFGELT